MWLWIAVFKISLLITLAIMCGIGLGIWILQLFFRED